MNSVLDQLTESGVPFKVGSHRPAVTAMETAAAQHVSGKRFAKAVVVKGEGRDILAVLPAHLQVDLTKLERLACSGDLKIASEAEFSDRFPNCQLGAMPPFGHLYGLEVYIDDDIASAPEVTFNGGTHDLTITMTAKDFLKTAEGVVGDFSQDPAEPFYDEW